MERPRAHPDTYSALPRPGAEYSVDEKVEQERTVRYFTDIETGERYYEVTSSPDVQEFLARLLKGIVPVADVMSITDSTGQVHTVSREMPLNDYPEENSVDVFVGEILLQVIFDDGDHSVEEDQNVVVNESGKGMLYDFEMFRDFHEYREEGLRKYIEDCLETYSIKNETVIVLLKKIQAIRNRICDTEFIDALFEKSKAEPTSWNDGLYQGMTQQELLKGIALRLDVFETILNERLEETQL